MIEREKIGMVSPLISICICPNCHVLLDYGAIISDPNQLISDNSHKIFVEYID